ncbi:hypothetical protein BGW36DRAFT_375942 [Talaromyces proteolyticus]|uniref:Uncharacterized protein n=1 Tax=Talaromyces proteolyticus TaxID=1131652 RepID=A0AAD4KSF0_9EURO|nr:uncharacterized protein BGW36DRAFT_375942 [Talaromyces proteolyticus]KAH8698357.1 hypothetical protein BGW36DRAFT_375942 [Talaromyces proteolyticus]
MAPYKPRSFTAGEDPLSKFIVVQNLPRPPDRQFLFHGIMRPSRGIYAELIKGGKNPPTHFHRSKWEFFRVLKGNLTINLNGVPAHVTSATGEIAVIPYTHHVIYGTPGTEMNEVKFVISATDRPAEDNVTGLDQEFFENWYGYQEDIFERGVKLDLIQALAMFDAGGTYLSPPWWVPFRSWVGLFLGIVMGRWIGGLLRYAPFYPEWTTDWQGACDIMERSYFQWRFVKRNAQQLARKKFEMKSLEIFLF